MIMTIFIFILLISLAFTLSDIITNEYKRTVDEFCKLECREGNNHRVYLYDTNKLVKF